MVSLEPPPEELLFPEPVSRAEFQRVQSSLGQLDSETVECQVRDRRIVKNNGGVCISLCRY